MRPKQLPAKARESVVSVVGIAPLLSFLFYFFAGTDTGNPIGKRGPVLRYGSKNRA